MASHVCLTIDFKGLDNDEFVAVSLLTKTFCECTDRVLYACKSELAHENQTTLMLIAEYLQNKFW